MQSMAQQQRSQEFKDRYKLKEAVVLSRHNIRSPPFRQQVGTRADDPA